MKEGQEKFSAFVLSCVPEDRKKDAEALLREAFSKQEQGTLNAIYLATGFAPKLLGMVKPEDREKVKDILLNFKKKL